MEQQLMYAGHYDKYFYGFQDDCSSIGMIFTIAKAMKDSGYVPENDILIVCHGAEEWGAIGTQFDWATGSWGTINQAKPEWAKNMLALFNFELCGFKEADTETGFIQSVPEFDTFVELFVDSFGDLVDTGAFSKGITGETSHVQTMEDGINYRMAGVPYLDGTAMASWLEETSDEELAKEAGVDVSAFQSKLENYHSYAQSLKKQAEDLNQKYADAYSGKDEKKMTELRKEGVDLNREILEFFEKSQDKMLGIEASSGVVTRQEGYINSLRLLKGALKACEEEVDWAEDEKSGALDQLWQLNGALAYDAILFSKENYEQTDSMYLDSARLFWGTGKVIELADINEATVAINENGDFDTAKPILEASYDRMLVKLKEAMETEMNGMEEITGE
ncbi:MAG: M28 family peptidase [Lachnospiraceae bacterium]|nr:M28 family peptidase [Lachnospiraceae bacterium]